MGADEGVRGGLAEEEEEEEGGRLRRWPVSRGEGRDGGPMLKDIVGRGVCVSLNGADAG